MLPVTKRTKTEGDGPPAKDSSIWGLRRRAHMTPEEIEEWTLEGTNA